MNGQARARRREVAEIRRRLAARGDPRRAAGEKAYLKSDLEFLGVEARGLRETVRAWHAGRPDPGHDELLGLVVALWATEVYELRAFACALLERHEGLLTTHDLPVLEGLLRSARTWALVDWIAPRAVGPLAEREPGRTGRALDRWAKDDDFWMRRASLLTLLLPLRSGEGDWARFVRMAEPMLGEPQFFVRKAIGWVLREVSKKRPALVTAYVEARLGRLSGVTFREAVRRLPSGVRERLARARDGR